MKKAKRDLRLTDPCNGPLDCGIIAVIDKSQEDIMAKETVQSVERAFQIIELMARNETMGIREIHHETGLTVTVVHRIMNTLVELGYAKQEKETEKYFLTYRLLVMGNYVQERNNVIRLVHPYLKQLSDECRETVHFVQRAGNKIRYIDKVLPTANIFATGSYIGLELEMSSTAVGKAILAELSEKEVTEIWNQGENIIFTPNTIQSLEQLKRDLTETKKTGFAYDWEERETGLFCVGVSIQDYKGDYNYGISISAPISRAKEDNLKRIRGRLSDTKQAVSELISGK